MSNDPSQKKVEASLSQPHKIQQLFLSLRMLAVTFLVAGIILVVILPLFSLSKRDEFILLIFYGLVSGGFLMARARSFTLKQNKTPKH
ncbi:hypothetical protein J7620_04390 [Wohlfahrtiimonas chitiniclastica]|uniref:hypothetical protein n=1 Tax=Wohlfahrtiimonas chitiniclastica TaxID=400946 RepID=UPI001BCAD683|nr:hypothetical protein [Wohlfahrtiimonas chitiniclastica]MBS7834188.1 hypothetical protein [Wohlfahrtiimonas chitiniclastica]